MGHTATEKQIPSLRCGMTNKWGTWRNDKQMGHLAE